MKLNGKKLAALVLTFAMALSMCNLSAYALYEEDITDVTFEFDSLEVPSGTSVSIVEDLLPTYADVEVDGVTERWYIGDELENWEVEYDVRNGVYECYTEPDWSVSGYYDSNDFHLFEFIVDTCDEFNNLELSYDLAYSDYDSENRLQVDDIIAELLEYEFEEFGIEVDSYDVRIDYDSCIYGEVDDYVYSVNLDNEAYSKLFADGYLEEEGIYFEARDEYGDIDFSGTLSITIYNTTKELVYTMNGEYDFYFGDWLIGKLEETMREDLDYVKFDLDSNNDCGTLYADDEYTEFDESERYYYYSNDPSDYLLTDLYFVPNGTYGDFEIEYHAYGEYTEEHAGVIYIECSNYWVIEASISNEDTYTFDSADFQTLVNEWNDDYSLIYIDNVRIATSNSGKLYYDYDYNSNRNVEIDRTEEYYVNDIEDDVIDKITYVPSSRATGTVTITFDAFARKSSSRSQTLSGVLKINIVEKADITIEAGYNGIVQIDPAVFQNYLDDVTNSTRYDVAYVTINNIPRNEKDGYLVTNARELTTKGAKTFYMNPDKGEYDLEDLYYMAGSSEKAARSTFVVYYYKTGTRPSATSEGIIEFTSGTGYSLIGETSAAQVMSFDRIETLTAFENMGSNDNVYVTFTDMPEGGKLYYKWGTSGQEDVKVGTAYYINYAYGARQLSYVTFVPSYSADKTMPKTVTIPLKAYDAQNQAVTGTINIKVSYASVSAQFEDVVTPIYADSVDFLFNQKITYGTNAANTTFTPYNNVTRAEFVTFLWRAAGSPEVTGVTNTFTDVKSTGDYSFAYKAILWAVKNGITTGRTATTFAPGAKVTHQELLTFLYRYDVVYLGHPGTGSSITGFYDHLQVAEWAALAVKWAAHKGILTGASIQPTANGTRATVALWLHRMLTL